MPGIAHEAPVELLRRNPLLAAALLRAFRMTIPSDQRASMVNGDVSSALPSELRADAVLLLGGSGTEPALRDKLAVVIEVQTAKDPGKGFVWPAYLTLARTQHKCPAVLLVICPRPDVGLWARHPIATGHPGFNLRPLVVDAHSTPLPDTPGLEWAASELAVLASFTGALNLERDKTRHQVLSTLANSKLDDDRLETYTHLIRAVASPAARTALEALMTTVYKDEFIDRIKAEGRAEARADTLLVVLAARGIEVPDGIREQMLACTDERELEVWTERAATATTLDDVFPS